MTKNFHAMERARGTERLLDIFDHLGKCERGQTAGEIATAIGAPRSSVYTITEALASRGYLERSPEGLLTIGSKIVVLALAFDQQSRISLVARSVVRDLAEATGEIAELNILDGWKQLVLIAENGPRQFYLKSQEGARYPIPRTASGRFLVAGFPKKEIESNIPENDFRLADDTVLSLDDFLGDIRNAQQDSYYCTRGMIDLNIACISAPIINKNEACVGAVSLVLPVSEFDRRRNELTAQVMQAAETLNSKIGYADFRP